MRENGERRNSRLGEGGERGRDKEKIKDERGG